MQKFKKECGHKFGRGPLGSPSATSILQRAPKARIHLHLNNAFYRTSIWLAAVRQGEDAPFLMSRETQKKLIMQDMQAAKNA